MVRSPDTEHGGKYVSVLTSTTRLLYMNKMRLGGDARGWKKVISRSDENMTHGNIKSMMKAAISFPLCTLLEFKNAKCYQWRTAVEKERQLKRWVKTTGYHHLQNTLINYSRAAWTKEENFKTDKQQNRPQNYETVFVKNCHISLLCLSTNDLIFI